MKIKRFEDIKSWKMARAVTNEIFDLSDLGKFAADYSLKNQIRRSSLSVMSNIAEGFERGGNREFLNFLSIAKGSCGEVRAQLYIAFDRKYLSIEEFQRIRSQLAQISKLLSAFMSYLKKSDLKGPKFK